MLKALFNKFFKNKKFKLIGDPEHKEMFNKGIPDPFNGDESGMGYVVGGTDLLWEDKQGNKHNHNLKYFCLVDCPSYNSDKVIVNLEKENKEELTGHALMIKYLEYVINNINNKNEFYKTDEDVANDLNISRQKAQRVKKACIDNGFLVKDFRRKRMIHVDVAKVKEHIKVTSV